MPRRIDRSPAATPPSEARSRRQFLQVLGATTAIPLVAGLPAWAQAPAPLAVPTSPPAAPPADPEAAADRADAESLLEILQRRYGSRWTAAQEDAVRDDVQGTLGAGRTLRKLVLRNSDEPAIIFVARGPGA